MDFEQEKKLEQDYAMSTFARKDVEFTQGHGMVLQDGEGKSYLDFLAGIGVVSLGHCHTTLVQAITDQVSKLIHVGNYYYIEKRGEVAKMLSEMIDDDPANGNGKKWKTFFANSGAEANECAIKLARLHARKSAIAKGVPEDEAPRLIVTLEGSFHGRTLATLAATAQPVKQRLFQPLPDGFVTTPLNDVAAFERLLCERGDEICAIMVECVQGESGVHPCTEEFLSAVRRESEDRGFLLICDEIQCGCYRTGLPFGFHHFGIIPDIATIAKGIASGVPCAACTARSDIADDFEPGDHGSTFGGSNVAIAAAFATLGVMGEEGFGDHVEEVGLYLRERLRQVRGISEVRGLGLMVGADLDESAPTAFQVVDEAQDAGVIINATGSSTLRFLPPLICAREHVDVLVDTLTKIIDA